MHVCGLCAIGFPREATGDRSYTVLVVAEGKFRCSEESVKLETGEVTKGPKSGMRGGGRAGIAGCLKGGDGDGTRVESGRLLAPSRTVSQKERGRF